MKSALAILFLALCSFVAAFPPACLIGAVNTQKNPVDLKKICGSDNVNVQNKLVDMCDNPKDGLDAFKKVCSEAGHNIKVIAATASASGTGSVSPSATGTATVSSGEETATGTESASPTKTNAAQPIKADSVIVAVVAVVGAVAAI